MIGDDAASFFVIMLGGPVLIDKVDIAHKAQIVDDSHALHIAITFQQIVSVESEQKHQVLAYQFVGLVDILGHQVEHKVPTSFATQIHNGVKVLDTRVVIFNLKSVSLDVVARQGRYIPIALTLLVVPTV